MATLTDRQRDVLATIRRLTREMGVAPSIRELGAALGVHYSTANAHVRALVAKRYVQRLYNTARGLRIVKRRVIR